MSSKRDQDKNAPEGDKELGAALKAVPSISFADPRTRAPVDERAGIDAFWHWWQDAAGDIAETLDAGKTMTFVEPLSGAVRHIAPGLAWELGRSADGGAHQLCVTGEGDPELRIVAERWLAAAPRGLDDRWTYVAARAPAPHLDIRIEIGDSAVDFAEFRVAAAVDENRERIDLRVYHPLFAETPEELRATATFLFLDSALGEDGVERWIGEVDIADAPLEGGGAEPAALREAVAALETAATGEKFAILRGTVDGAPMIATANQAVKRIEHVLFDTHLCFRIALEDPNEHGMPSTEEADALGELEDALCAALGDGGVFLARETTRGERSVHFHVAREGGALGKAWRFVTAHPAARRIEVAARFDPRWAILERWRGGGDA